MVILLAIVSFLALLVAAPGYVFKMALVAVFLALALWGALVAFLVVSGVASHGADGIAIAWMAGGLVSVGALKIILS